MRPCEEDRESQFKIPSPGKPGLIQWGSDDTKCLTIPVPHSQGSAVLLGACGNGTATWLIRDGDPLIRWAAHPEVCLDLKADVAEGAVLESPEGWVQLWHCD